MGEGTPFVYGIFRPRIYLPEGLSLQEERYILLHEEIHIRRGDSMIRALAWLALVLHWFNPLVWAAFHFSGRDMEESCDEAVIRRLGNEVKKEYSASLLAFAAGQKRYQVRKAVSRISCISGNLESFLQGRCWLSARLWRCGCWQIRLPDQKQMGS